MTKQMLID